MKEQPTLEQAKTNVCSELIFNPQEVKVTDSLGSNRLDLLQLMVTLN